MSLSHQPKQPMVYLQLGHIDLSQGQNEKARHHYAQALRLQPELVDALLSMGQLCLSEGQQDEAIRWYERAVDVQPKRADAYLQLGELYFRKGELAQAQSWYEKTLSVTRGRFTYIASLKAGVCALQLGDPQGAEQHLRRASEAEPTAWRPLYRLACAESQQGDVEAALGALEAAAANGFANAPRLQSDACLRLLAPEPRFQVLVSTLGGGTPR